MLRLTYSGQWLALGWSVIQVPQQMAQLPHIALIQRTITEPALLAWLLVTDILPRVCRTASVQAPSINTPAITSALLRSATPVGSVMNEFVHGFCSLQVSLEVKLRHR